uniref:Epoxidase pydX n=1 Tax=Acremonium sp. TaxID=2046025 RepID=PYDX_ACRSP|nr:RecName: Full=Epoxidase pydX; AltName: Full=Pyrrocidines biosynthesis cluster protein X; Flags: Precursor [Acremonium sp.]QXF14598.1 PydX [Acremonium sp.]
MSLIALPLRLLRLLPAITSTWVLAFALDEHLIFGTWVQPSLRESANANLPAWWTTGGLRWRWILIVVYPINYALGVVNLFVGRDELRATGAMSWYTIGLLFSLAHMGYMRTALDRIGMIERGVPRGNVTSSMESWLRMNRTRALVTDLPAWICFVTAALKAL